MKSNIAAEKEEYKNKKLFVNCKGKSVGKFQCNIHMLGSMIMNYQYCEDKEREYIASVVDFHHDYY